MKKKIFNWALLVLAIAITSCNPREEVGPAICPPSGFVFTADSIVINGLTNNEVDLSQGGIHIQAGFGGNAVNWELTIQSSNGISVKNYSGKSEVVDVRWFGNSNKMPWFGLGKVTVTLEVACLDAVSKTFEVTGKPNFKNLHPSFGVLIRDFDKNGAFPVADADYTGSDGWLGINADISQSFNYLSSLTDPVFESSPAGGKSGVIAGEMTSPTWYFGATSFGDNTMDQMVSTNDPDSLYFNFFAKKAEGIKNGGIEIGIQSAGDNFMYLEALADNNWHYRGVKVSELLRGKTEPLSTLTGAAAVVLSLGAAPEEDTKLKMAYDFIIITVNEPLFPDEN